MNEDKTAKEKKVMKPFKVNPGVSPRRVTPKLELDSKIDPESAGFPIIESIIEKQDYEKLNKWYREAVGKLTWIVKNDKSTQRIEAAEASILAFDKTIQLIQELENLRGQLNQLK